jgi:hypothetical protein
VPLALDQAVESHAGTSQALTNLVHEMLKVNPKARPNAENIHALFDVVVNAGQNFLTIETDNSLLLKMRQLSLSDERDEDQTLLYVSKPLKY